MHLTNPPLPFCGPLGVRLSPGTLIRINGHVSHSPTCFSINLQTGGCVNPRDDVALHLSAVFTPPARVVRNSIQSNLWGAEESYGGFPLSAGNRFEFMIMVESSEYRIAINGTHFTEFRHRIPFESVNHLAVDGDVSIQSIHIDGGVAHTSAMPNYSTAPSGQAPYPPAMGLGMPPYPPMGGTDLYPPMGGTDLFPPVPPPAYSAYPPPAASGTGYPPPPVSGGYYPPSSGPQPPPTSGYYPATSGPQPTGGYYPPSSGHPPPPPAGYSSQPKSGGIGGMLSGLTAGVAGTAIGSALLGKHGKHNKHGHAGGFLGGHHQQQHPKHHSGSGIPIAGLAAGAGAAALGTYMLAKHNPLKKAKKLFKHKHKMGKWSHKGWGSSSSSSSEEEE